MQAPSATDVLLFGEFRLDRRIGVLFRRDECGTFAPLPMGSRALGVLGALAERAAEVISRTEIIAAVWPNTAVEDSNLDVQIAALRRVLDAGRMDGSCIQTVRGRGYRFTAPVTRNVSDVATLRAGDMPPLPDKPSLAVMPFQNMSGDPEQEYFADGMVEEITTASLSHPLAVRNRPQFELHLQGSRHRLEAGRPRTGRALYPRRLGAQSRP